MDIDSKYTYSKTISLASDKIKELKIYPNLSRGDLTIDLSSSERKFVIEVFDMLGKTVFRENTEGISVYKINANNWQLGIIY